MSKLYPPYIEGTIPAFYTDSDRGTVLTVPFSMNKTVSKSAVSGFRAKIKTVQSGTFLASLSDYAFDIDQQYVEFKFTDSQVKNFNLGQYYKVQIAYDHNGEEGYYSTVGITKYTTAPDITISGLVANSINLHQYTYTGYYSQLNKDSTEKEYSYQFIIYDEDNKIIDDTGVLLHNNSSDMNSYESYDTYSYLADLDMTKSYYLVYKVTTSNNLEISSPRYRLMQRQSITPQIRATLEATMNYDNGYIDVNLVGETDDEGIEYATTGKFLLTRSDSDSNFTEWNELLRFSLHSQNPSRALWRDFTIEQGKKYVYSLQQYNDANFYSTRMLSEEIFADFEDIFLYDGERQLKVRFNPKVTSFKTDFLETKLDTIGSKFPFIFRNGNVKYKEFPISGLISYHSDSDNLFMTDTELGFDTTMAKIGRTYTGTPAIKSTNFDKVENANVKTTDLSGYNISAERKFKLTALEWLTNGEPKLFRSPAEGNYIVRLLNVSMSPEDKVNRMLHTFTCTAYEIAECSYENLSQFNIISVEEPDSEQMCFATINLATNTLSTEVWDNEQEAYVPVYSNTITYASGEILPKGTTALGVTFTDLTPGSIVTIQQSGQLSQQIMIGATGFYQVDPTVNIVSIKIPSGAKYQGLVTYSYYTKDVVSSNFNNISYIDTVEVPAKQFIGKQSNIVEQIEDVKTTISKFYYLRFLERQIEQVYRAGNTYYKDSAHTIPLTSDDNIFALYAYTEDACWVGGYYFRGMRETTVTEESFPLGKYYYLKRYTFLEAKEYAEGTTYYVEDPFIFYYDMANPDQKIISVDSYERIEKLVNIIGDKTILNELNEYSTEVAIDGSVISLDDIGKYEAFVPALYTTIETDSGVVMECGYEIRVINYEIETESTNSQLKAAKTNLENVTYYLSSETMKGMCLPLSSSTYNDELYTTKVTEAREKYHSVYNKYIEVVEKILSEQEDEDA